MKNSTSALATRSVVFYPVDNWGGWFTVISSSVLLASFSFVGIETVATTAQEAKFSPIHNSAISRHTSSNDQEHRENTGSSALDTTANNPFKFIVWIPIVATVTYVWGGWIVSQNVGRDNPCLPVLLGQTPSSCGSTSIFFISANDYHHNADQNTSTNTSTQMGNAITILLLISVSSTSSTALYVATRTLFGFAYTETKRHPGEQGPFFKTMSFLSKKSKFDVPYRAVLASAWLLGLPFLKYLPAAESSVYGNVSLLDISRPTVV